MRYWPISTQTQRPTLYSMVFRLMQSSHDCRYAEYPSCAEETSIERSSSETSPLIILSLSSDRLVLLFILEL